MGRSIQKTVEDPFDVVAFSSRPLAKPHFSEWHRSVPNEPPATLAKSIFHASFLIGLAILVGAVAPTSLLFLICCSPVAVTLFMLRPKSRGPRALSRLQDLPASVRQYPVHVRLVYGSRKEAFQTGSDDGIVTISDGLIHFSGFKMSFSLRSQDVKIQPKTLGSSIESIVASTELEGQNRMGITFDAYDRIPGSKERQRVDFAADMLAVRRQNCEVANYSTFPPLETRMPSFPTVESLAESGAISWMAALFPAVGHLIVIWGLSWQSLAFLLGGLSLASISFYQQYLGSKRRFEKISRIARALGDKIDLVKP